MAAWVLPELPARGCASRMLPLLVADPVPAGPVLTLLLAYALGAELAADRAEAAAAVRALAARGTLDAAALGRDLGALVAGRGVVLGRTIGPLRAAAAAGAAPAVCAAVRPR